MQKPWMALNWAVIAFALVANHGTLVLGQVAPRGPVGTNQPQQHGTLSQPQGTLQGQPTPQAQAEPPRGFAINAAQQQWVDQVLGFWEFHSAKIDTYSCGFTRWEYNPAYVRDPNTPWTVAEGMIKYAQPDKGMYRVDEVRFYQAPKKPEDAPTWAKREGLYGENWICDGQAVFEHDYLNKQLIERPLPEHMRGQAIAEGPLPFLFGAKAAKLKQRYWIAPMSPPNDPKTGKPREEYWLAAKPKMQSDAANFELVEIILDQKEFLPVALQIYLPGGRERKVFQFADRKINSPLTLFQKDFSKPSVPVGWKKVVDNGQAPAASRALAPTGIRERQDTAARPPQTRAN